MTKNEAFKRRIRQRMAKTGERYGAANDLEPWKQYWTDWLAALADG